MENLARRQRGGRGVKPEFWRDRPVLVTGATGLVGSWLVKRLAKVHAEIVCLVRDWVPQSELISGSLLDYVKVVRGDMRDQALLERCLGEYEIATVFHLAAQTIVGVANRNPVSTFESNIGGTWSLLEACRRSPAVQQIIVASSDKAYGDQTVLPYDETTSLRGKHPYDVSKSCADLISAAYAHTYCLPVCVTRCGNFYGGGDLNWSRIVPGTMRSIIRGERPVIRSDGSCLRDYFYVEDGAAAYMHLAEKMSSDPEVIGEAFNFSNEVRLTVAELVERILGIARSSLQPDIQAVSKNEIMHQYLSAEKARRLLGWSPEFGIDDALQSTMAWYRQYFAVSEQAARAA
jgi:CDP-glucose 4,6-dehydratase